MQILLLITSQKCRLLLGNSGQKLTQKQHKMTVSASTETFENLKRENCRSHISKTCPVCVPP